MVLKFSDVYYDKMEDMPLAVLIDDIKKCYYYPISFSIAEDLITVSMGGGDFDIPLKNLITDLVEYANAKIVSLYLNDDECGKCSGHIVLNYSGKDKDYKMSPDQLILFSTLFGVPISVDGKSVGELTAADLYYTDCEFDTNSVN